MCFNVVNTFKARSDQHPICYFSDSTISIQSNLGEWSHILGIRKKCLPKRGVYSSEVNNVVSVYICGLDHYSPSIVHSTGHQILSTGINENICNK